jgi:hypothetical protein
MLVATQRFFHLYAYRDSCITGVEMRPACRRPVENVQLSNEYQRNGKSESNHQARIDGTWV